MTTFPRFSFFFQRCHVGHCVQQQFGGSAGKEEEREERKEKKREREREKMKIEIKNKNKRTTAPANF